MGLKKIALINDVTGYSKCSIAAMLPIVSAMGVEGIIIPTAILSINTYWDNYYFDDYTNRMNEYIKTYKDLNLHFDGIATGFLGSTKQISIVIDFIKHFKKEDNFVLVDPVMGDHGKLYPTYNKDMREKMRSLIPYANIITPNLTELCALLDTKYPTTTISNDTLYDMCKQLSKLGPEKIVVTGLDRGDYIANFIYEKGKDYEVIETKRIGNDRSGTGDVVSAVIAGSMINGSSFKQAVSKAASFTSKCIKYSEEVKQDNHLGLCFEPFLKEL
ncbi:MAG: pyridoxamine kinase [Thomasclavelia sp.]|jgi:pyridoxine kinase|nr:pyridoxamine kinase [Thomasclavelia sp.]